MAVTARRIDREPESVFARLKLRMMFNGLRGRPGRLIMVVFGGIFGAWFALIAFIVFALPGFLDDARIASMVLPIGGGVAVLGWLLLPLVLFGVDESLDPARFALLPLRRGTLIRGMLAAAVVGVPALGTLAATLGMVFTVTRLSGIGAGLVEFVGVVLGLLMCVTASRAVTSAFAGGLRSRRGRDAATVLLAAVAALLGPIQILVLAGARRTDWHQVAVVARVVEWTPFGAPYAIGNDLIAGRAWGVPVKLGIVLAAIGLLLWWWSRTLERAMFSASTDHVSRVKQGDPVAQLVLPFLPRSRFGALTSREARYWWRESRRRASLITFSVVGIFVPVMLSATGGSGPGVLPFVGALAAVGLANQFGFDGTAYAANIVSGVPGRAEIHSRVAGYSIYAVPVLVLAAVVIGLVAGGGPGAIPSLLGSLVAAYGVGLAVVLPISIFGAYAMPDSANPFAASTGSGTAKAFIGLAALIGAAVGAAPVVLLSYSAHGFWLVAGLPIGLAYGVGAFVVGSRIAGRILDGRMPEVLAAVTPDR